MSRNRRFPRMNPGCMYRHRAGRDAARKFPRRLGCVNP